MSECPYCANSAWRTGTKSRTILDVDDQGNPETQVIRVQRWQCKQCMSFFTTGANTSGFKAITSPRAREQIARDAIRSGYTQTGQRFGLDVKTVRKLWLEWKDIYERDLPERVPAQIGIHLIKIAGYDRTLITNFEKQTVVDILKGTDRELLLEWFDSKGGDAIDHAVISVHVPYKQAVIKHSPKAQVCVLQNHIAAQANSVFLNALRTRRRILGAGSYRNVKEAARTFATRTFDLTLSQREDMLAWDSSIQILYSSKEDFIIALELSDVNLLEKVKASCSAIPSLSSREFIEVWKQEIIAIPCHELKFEKALIDMNVAFRRSKLIQSFDLLRAHTLLNKEQLIDYPDKLERPVAQGVPITDVLENLVKAAEPLSGTFSNFPCKVD